MCVGSNQHLFLLLPLHEFSKQRFGFFGRWFIPSSRRNRARKFGNSGLRDCGLGKLWNQDEKDEHNNRRNTDTCDKADNADQANVRAATNQARCLGILGVEVAFWADVSHLPSQRQTMARRRRRPGEPAWSSLSHLGLDKSKYDSAPSRFSCRTSRRDFTPSMSRTVKRSRARRITFLVLSRAQSRRASLATKSGRKTWPGAQLLTPSSETAGRELNLTVHFSTVASGTLTQLPQTATWLGSNLR